VLNFELIIIGLAVFCVLGFLCARTNPYSKGTVHMLIHVLDSVSHKVLIGCPVYFVVMLLGVASQVKLQTLVLTKNTLWIQVSWDVVLCFWVNSSKMLESYGADMFRCEQCSRTAEPVTRDITGELNAQQHHSTCLEFSCMLRSAVSVLVLVCHPPPHHHHHHRSLLLKFMNKCSCYSSTRRTEVTRG
jgi:hypothetical protein